MSVYLRVVNKLEMFCSDAGIVCIQSIIIVLFIVNLMPIYMFIKKYIQATLVHCLILINEC